MISQFDLTRQQLIDVAKSLDLDTEKFKEDFKSMKVRNAVTKDMGTAIGMGVNSVPSLVINRKYKVSGAVSYNRLEEVISEILQMKE